MADITVIILTLNEELHIERAIKSVKSFAADIIIVDSNSTDRTVEIAASLGARIYKNTFVNYARQFAWALQREISTEWVMRLDADEFVEPALAEEIAEKLPTLSPDVTGIEITYKLIFMNRWIRYGGRYPMYLLRIWRTGCGAIENRWMDEHIALLRGRATRFSGAFRDHNLKGLTFFIEKHNHYATREAVDILQRMGVLGPASELEKRRITGQAGYKRLMKTTLYDRLNPLCAPFLYFIYRYIIRLGFLDGREGTIYHVLQGFWYRFLVGAKLYELNAALRDVASADLRAAKLEQLTGLEIRPKNVSLQ